MRGSFRAHASTLALAGLLGALGAMAVAGAASANCTGLPASVAEVRDSAKVIVVGTVVASRFGGAAYDLEVTQVITGDVASGRWSFGPTADPGSRSSQCLADPIPVRTRVVLSISTAPVANDHSFVDYFWWPIKADGTVGVRSSWQTEHTLTALLATLGGQPPATDVAVVSPPRSDDSPLPVLVGVGAFGLALVYNRPTRRHPRPPA